MNIRSWNNYQIRAWISDYKIIIRLKDEYLTTIICKHSICLFVWGYVHDYYITACVNWSQDNWTVTFSVQYMCTHNKNNGHNTVRNIAMSVDVAVSQSPSGNDCQWRISNSILPPHTHTHNNTHAPTKKIDHPPFSPENGFLHGQTNRQIDRQADM